MQEFDIDQLIGMAQRDPQAFEARRRRLIAACVAGSDNPLVADELQSALSSLWPVPTGEGSAALRTVLGRLDGEFQHRLALSRHYLKDSAMAAGQTGGTARSVEA